MKLPSKLMLHKASCHCCRCCNRHCSSHATCDAHPAPHLKLPSGLIMYQGLLPLLLLLLLPPLLLLCCLPGTQQRT
jgi:hypothetical protein